MSDIKGLHKGLTSYGDTGFSLFLRKAFIKGAGYTDDALDRTIIGIADTGSAYNPCHGNSVQLVDGSIVLRLDDDAQRLRMTAIGDDWFRIEASFDCVTFDQLTLTPRAGPGLRTQEIDLPPRDIRPYPFIRISAHDGPWPFWIAELAALGRAP